MDIGILEKDKEDLLKLQEKYYEKLIDIIRKNDSQIREYKNKLKELEEENFTIKVNSEIIKDRLYKHEDTIKELRAEIIKLEDELYEKKINDSYEGELIRDLQEAYLSNDNEDVEIIMDSILDNIENIEKHLDKKDMTKLMFIFYIYNELVSLLNNSLEAERYYESDTIEASLIRLLDNENKCKLYDIVESCPQEIIKTSNGLFIDLEDNLRRKIIDDIIDISYKSFNIAEDKDGLIQEDKTIQIKAWAKIKDKNAWILIKGLYSINQSKLYVDKDIIGNLNINIKETMNSIKVSNEDIVKTYNELKKVFLLEGVGYFKKCNTSQKKYSGDNKIINTILNSDINKENISVEGAQTLLLISFFYNFHNELLNSSKYMESVFKSNNIESIFVRLLDLEKYMREGKSVTMPVSIFAKNNAHKIKNIDLQVKEKVLKIINEYWKKEISNLLIIDALEERCGYDNEILTSGSGYLRYINADKKPLYVLVQYKYCGKCKFSYLSKERITQLSKKFKLYKLDESRFKVLDGRDSKLNLEIKTIVENDIGSKLYYKLLGEFNNDNIKKSLGTYSDIIRENSILKSLSRMKCITLLFIGYLLQNNTAGSDRIKLIGNVGTSADTILYNKMVNRKDFNDYLRLNKDSLNLIDPIVKEKVLKEIIDIGTTNAALNIGNSKREEYFENNLSAESVIKKLGYSTSLGREVRWNMLENKVIPKIGKVKVINHISFLIRMNKNRSSMANAVNEWKHDLNRLLKV